MPDRRGLVLAAGYGTRLRPVSDHVPKPLLPLDGRALLDRAADRLIEAGCGLVVVNAHHLADRIAAHLDGRPDRARFHLSMESSILGTGGAFHGARAALAGADTILAFNGDVHCPLPLGPVASAHEASGALATLVLVDRPAVNTVLVDGDGAVRDLADRLRPAPQPGDRRVTFTGLACYARALLHHVPEGASDLVAVLAELIRTRPGSVRSYHHEGAWDDLGTLARYLDAHRRLLGPGFASVAEGARVPSSVRLDECVVLAGADLPPEVRLRRAVCGPGWAVSSDVADDPGLAVAAAAGFGEGVELQWITGHGSDRRFMRLRSPDRRAVLMTTPQDDDEHARFVAIASFLHEADLGAPAILARDDRRRAVVMEDLGRDTLGSLARSRPEEAEAFYDRVLERLAEVQTVGTARRQNCPMAWDRRFDRAHLRWETEYFRTRFLVGHRGRPCEATSGLDQLFELLATACLAQPYTLVHRDFQSENILIQGGEVRLVDVQGMRWGPVAYDAVSLLYDPYVDLPESLRERLLASFPDRLGRRGGPRPTAEAWRGMTVAAGLQRIMQALGAFAFLGHEKGRRRFLDHIPAAERRLRRLCDLALDSTDAARCPPALHRIADSLD